jgi:hypothetical protein
MFINQCYTEWTDQKMAGESGFVSNCVDVGEMKNEKKRKSESWVKCINHDHQNTIAIKSK